MADEAEPDLLHRIELEARKVPPLPYVLFLYAFVTCPIWILALVVAIAEILSAPAPAPDNLYVAVFWINSGGMIVSFVVTIFAARRVVIRQAALAENAADISIFRLGWGAVRVGWKGWWSVLVVVLFVVYMVAGQDLLETSLGVNRPELTEAGRYWIVVARAAVISSLIFCFFGFCTWLGHRVQKQTTAKRDSA
jgi:hypothetical protein